MSALKAPFPYFGGKSRIAPEVWARLGNVSRYIEPFAGSLAVLLARPQPFSGREIVNDSDGLLVNTWRAMAADPGAVAEWADWPATEPDLHARHAWLVGKREDITRRLEGDPGWFDPKAAGWWLWGIGLWIGSGWCSGEGPWRVSEDGQLLHAGSDGRGVHRQLLHAGNDGRGVHRQLLHAGSDGQGSTTARASTGNDVEELFGQLSTRLRDAFIMCGDWSRVVSPTVLSGGGGSGPTGVFLDPPYSEGEAGYAHNDMTLDAAVREWAITNGDNPGLRIALCGYEGHHEMPSSWSVLEWSAQGGYQARGGTSANRRRERVWFSPHCHRAGLWEGVA